MAVEMKKINFQDFQEPAVGAENLNQMQKNIEDAINEGVGSGDGILTGSVIGYNGGTIPEGYEEVINSGSFGDSVPIGTGMDYFGTVTPKNYLFADGSAISRTEYAELFAIIGTTYGSGDGSTTFNLPDKRERVSVMYKSGSANGTSGATLGTLGAKGGEFKHKMTASELVKHRHSELSIDDASLTLNNGTSATGKMGLDYTGDKSYGTIQTGYTGSSTPFNVMQPYLVCNYIIKVK